MPQRDDDGEEESGSPFIATSAVQPTATLETAGDPRPPLLRPGILVAGMAAVAVLIFGFVSSQPSRMDVTDLGEGGVEGLVQPDPSVVPEADSVPGDDPPVACFTLSSNTVDQGEALFPANCSVNASSFSWDFGNGNSSSQQAPTIVYLNAGSYTVALTASGAGGAATFTQAIVVNEADIDSISAADVPNIAPAKIGCTTISASEWNWAWEVLPSWVDEYVVQFADGTRTSVGPQPGVFSTTENVAAIIAVREGEEFRTSVSVSGFCSSLGEVATPTGIRCEFSNFRFENDVWTWSERWSWVLDDAVSAYRVVVERDGVSEEVELDAPLTSFETDPTNGAANSGNTLRAVIALGPNGETATRNISTCGAEGGTGWQSPPG